MRLKLFFLFLFVAMVSGCESVDYDYLPPASEQGKQCVVQCASVREECRRNENERVQFEKRACERRVESDFRACLSAANNKDQEKKCRERRDRVSCSVSDNLGRCDDEYKLCFSHCGGVINKVVTRSSEIRDAITKSEQVEKTKRATRAALATHGYRPVPCSISVPTVYCDDFTDTRSGISVWVPRDDPKTVRMSYTCLDTPTDPSEELFKAVMSAIEPVQN